VNNPGSKRKKSQIGGKENHGNDIE
jgi:hypothetical protein